MLKPSKRHVVLKVLTPNKVYFFLKKGIAYGYQQGLNMVAILMSAKLAYLGLLKIEDFEIMVMTT